MATSSRLSAAALHALDVLADAARLLRAVPDADDLDLLAVALVGPQSLAEAAGVVGDEPVGGGEDVRGRAVVLFEANNLCAGKIFLEAQDVGDLGPAPGVDRLVVVADAAQVTARLGKEFEPGVLRLVGVLIFVDEDVAEALAVALQHVGMRAEDGEHVEQQVAEVAGVQGAQAVLVGGIELAAAAGTEALRLAEVYFLRGPAAILPAVDEAGELARGPALLVEIGGADQLLEHAQLVVGVEDGEVGLQADELGMAAEHARGDRVEGAEPGHPLDRAAGDFRDALLHLARGLVGEGDGEDLARPRLAGSDQIGEAGGEGGGLAGAGAGEDQHRAFGREHGLPLRRVEAGEPWGFGGGCGTFGHCLRGREGTSERQRGYGRIAATMAHGRCRTKGDRKCRGVNAIAVR